MRRLPCTGSAWFPAATAGCHPMRGAPLLQGQGSCLAEAGLRAKGIAMGRLHKFNWPGWWWSGEGCRSPRCARVGSRGEREGRGGASARGSQRCRARAGGPEQQRVSWSCCFRRRAARERAARARHASARLSPPAILSARPALLPCAFSCRPADALSRPRLLCRLAACTRTWPTCSRRTWWTAQRGPAMSRPRLTYSRTAGALRGAETPPQWPPSRPPKSSECSTASSPAAWCR